MSQRTGQASPQAQVINRPSGNSNLSNAINQEVAQIDQKINLLKSLPTDQDGLRVTKQTGLSGTRDGQLRILGMNRDRLLAKAAGGQNEGFLGDVGSAVSSGAANFDKAIGYVTGNVDLQQQARRRQQISGAEMTDYGREAREKGVLGKDMSLGQRAYAAMLAVAESTPELVGGAIATAAVGALAPEAAVAAIGAKIISQTPRLAKLFGATAAMGGREAAQVVGKRAIMTVAGMGIEGTQAGLSAGSDVTAQALEQINSNPEAFAQSALGKKLIAENNGDFEAAKIAAANQVGRAAALSTGATTALMSIPASVFEARILSGSAGRGTLKELGIGTAAESAQEAPQSGSEQLINNLSLQRVGSDVGTFEGVAKAAGEGAIVGGLMGGGIGAGASAVNRLTGNAPDDQPRPAEDEELVAALSARGEATPPREGGGLIEDQNAVALRGMDNIAAGGMNYTPEQIMDFARNNESNPRIADIMSQPVSDVTKVQQVARILNQEEASRVEPEAVRRISGMFGGTNSVSTSKQMIGDELAKINPAVIAESPTLSSIAKSLESTGKQFVSGLRNAVSNYQPTAPTGTLFARPERGREGSVVMTPNQVADEAQRERNTQEAITLAEVRQQRFDAATGTGAQREDLRAGATNPEETFYLNPEFYGDELGGTVATMVGAENGKVRIQYPSPTEVGRDGKPETISEDVEPATLFSRVLRGTPRMTQELAADARKPKRGTGTDFDPRNSVDRTSTRAIVPTQDAGPPTTISPTRMTGFEENTDQLPVEQQAQNAQVNPQQERAPNVQGNVEGPNEISGPPATLQPQAPEVQTTPAEETAPTEETAPAEEATPTETDQEPEPKKPAQDDGGRVEKHVENIEDKILDLDRSGVVRYADKVHKEGLIDDADLAEIKRMSKDKDMGAEDIGPELISQLNTKRDDGGKRYSGRRETVRAPRKKASDVVRDTPLSKDKTPDSEEVSKPDIDYDAVIQDRLDKIAARGAQGKVVANRLRSLLKQNNYDVTQLYYAFQMGEVVSRVLPKNAKVDILFVPSITASDAKAAAASGVDLGEEAGGSYDAYKISPNGFRGLITLSLSDNVTGASRENAAHEAFHVIQDMLRAYDPEAFKLINNSFRDDMRIDDLDPSILRKLKTLTTDGEGSVYDGLIASLGDTPLSRFEAQAVAFGALVDAKDRGVDMKGLKASFIRVVDFISDMLRGFRNIFRINGVESVAEIFEGYRTGKAQENMTEAAPLREDEQQIQYSGRVPKNPAVTSSLEHNFNILQNKSFRKGRDLKMFIQERVKSSLDESGINAEDYEANETFKYLTKMAVKDAEYALQENANAIGWYDEKVSKALAVLSLVHPEIATDRQSKFAFIWALAVSSNGLKVNPNFEIAEKAYRIYKETGAMPTDIGIGTAADAIDGHMKLFNVMMDRLGFDELERLMTTKATVKEIERETGIDVSGEGKAEIVFGAAILGPKIGNGFFANLYGHFDQLTMDRWLMRTWGRWTGTLVSVKEKNVEKGRDVLSRLVSALDDGQRSELGEIIGLNVDDADADTIAVAIQKSSIKPANRTKISDIGRGDTTGLEAIVGKQKGRFKHVGLGDEIRKKGNGLAGYLDGQKEAPAGANERKYIRSVFQSTLATLKKKYPKLTTADLQALLWYPEKRLYEAAKTDEVNEGYDDDNAPDYANAAILVAKNAGVSDEQIRQANEAVDARLRSNVSSAGAGRGGAGVSKQYSGRTGRTDQDLATKLRSRFEGTPRVEEGSPAEGNVGRRSGGVLANSVTGRVPVTATYSHSTPVKDLFEESGFDTPDFHELTRGKAAGKLYTRLINDSKQDNRFGASVYVYPENEYQDMRLFVTKDGMSGFALKGDDIVSAFKSPKSADRGVAFSMIRMAVALGGRKLDAFDTVLPSIYSVSGFKGVARMRWNDEFKPDDWNKETFKAFNGGEPDVVFMAYDQNREGLYSPDEGEYTDNYDQAVAAQGGDVQYSGVRRPANLNIGGKATKPSIRPNAPKFKTGPAVLGVDPMAERFPRLVNFYEKLVNRTRSVKQLTKNIDDFYNDKTNIDRAEQLMGSRAAYTTQEFHLNELQPVLKEIGKQGLSINEVETYMHNRHAAERNAVIRQRNDAFQDGGSGINDAAAKAYLAALSPAKRNRLDAVAKKLDVITNGTLQVLQDSGIESAETVRNLRNAYKFYVPLFREGVDGGHALGTRGASVEGSALKAAVGSSKPVNNILANIVTQREAAINRAEANRLGNTVFQAALENKDQTFWMVIDPSTATLDQVRKQLVSMGMDPDLADDIFKSPTKRAYNKRTGNVDTIVDTAFKRQPNVFATRVDGADKFIVFNPDEKMATDIAAVLKNEDLPTLEGASAAFINNVGRITRMWSQLRTQYMPEFGPVNFTRDMWGVMVNLTSTPLDGEQFKIMAKAPLYAKKLVRVIRATDSGEPTPAGSQEVADLFDRFEKAGGRTAIRESFFKNFDRDPEKLEAELQKAVKQLSTGKTSAPKVVVDYVTAWNDALENATRLATFKIAIDRGMTDAQAAEIAKNITVNFNQKGQWTREINSLYGFANASIASTDRNIKTMLGKAGKKILIGGVGLGVIQGLALAAAGYDEDGIPEWVKDHAFIIPLGLFTDTDKYVAIPMPYFYNMFPAIGRRMVEAARGQLSFGQFVGGTAKVMINSVNPIAYGAGFIEFVSPSVFDMFVQYAMNEDGLGRRIYNKDFNDLNPTTGMSRARGDTTVMYAMYSRAAEVINYVTGGDEYEVGGMSPTPEEIKFFVEQVLPPMQFLYRSTGTLEKGFSGEQIEANDIAFVRRFYGEVGGKTAEGGKFYDNVKAVNELKRTVKLREENDQDTTEVFDENPKAELIDSVGSYYRDVSDLRRERRKMILEGAKPSETQKLDDEITAIMTEFNDLIEEAEKR